MRHRVVQNENGQSVMEFAMIVPLLIGVIMWLISSGLQFYSNIAVASAAREAARYAAIYETNLNDPDDRIYEIVERALATVIPGGTYELQVKWVSEDGIQHDSLTTEDDWIEAVIVYDYQPLLRAEVIKVLLLGPAEETKLVQLIGSAIFKNERWLY